MKDYGSPLRRILAEAGCRFLRHGRGDHEIWRNDEGEVLEVHAEGALRSLIWIAEHYDWGQAALDDYASSLRDDQEDAEESETAG